MKSNHCLCTICEEDTIKKVHLKNESPIRGKMNFTAKIQSQTEEQEAKQADCDSDKFGMSLFQRLHSSHVSWY